MTTPTLPVRATDAASEPVSLGFFNGFEIYPMPMFATIGVADVAAVTAWYEAALGFGVVFTAPGLDGTPSLVHLRRHKYQDVLLVPAASTVAPASSFTISFQAGEDMTALATRARAVPALGASAVVGPIDTPWNTTDLRVIDPAGYRLVFTSRRTAPDPDQAARWAAMMALARHRGGGSESA